MIPYLEKHFKTQSDTNILMYLNFSMCCPSTKSQKGEPLAISFSLFGFGFGLFFILYLRERQTDRQSASRGGAERWKRNPKQDPGSELSAQSLMQGLNSQAVRS